MNENDNQENLFEMYIGIETDQGENAPSICVEFPISYNVFAIAFILAKLEECQQEDDENDYKDD